MPTYKQGDTREDGFIFDHYDLKVPDMGEETPF